MGERMPTTELSEMPKRPTVLERLPCEEEVAARLSAWRAQEKLLPAKSTVHALLLSVRRPDALAYAYGAGAGDQALDVIADRVNHFAALEVDGPWTLCRRGKDGFLLVAREASGEDRWQLLAERLSEEVAMPIPVDGGVLRLTPRIGMSCVGDGESLDAIMDRLDLALQAAQGWEGGFVAWADVDGDTPGRSLAELEADLLGAIDRDEIEVLFQPQFSLADDRLTGAEALARWNHPEIGRLGAATLFALAERTDHMAPLSRHIAACALDHARGWPGDLRLSINVTPADLAFGTYVRQMLELVREKGFAAERLTLEITEQALIHNLEQAARIMAEFSRAGIRIALDDFGAGFCNFRYLKVLPLDYLKLDRSMIEDVTSDRKDLAVLRAIIAMARALDLEVIAEGIESEEQRAIVEAEGCSTYQGFLRAQPMSAAMFDMLIG
jgi:diguanylate cyclase